MKTSLNIPTEDLEELMRAFPKMSRTDAIVCAVREFNRRRKLQKLSAKLGTLDHFIDLRELKRLRKSE